ncbi:MAG: Asp-tRNA(Asn)/Glu-tRNA(Gln) amidotransferase subunit GatB, partial [Actinomycetota bacterium]
MTVSQAAQGQEAYETVIGLEIHAELATNSKMFCGCPVSFGEAPNTRTCPVCLGEPGSLPVVNERAVRDGIAMGLALDCRIAEHCQFHRKNYFYPDMPKNYQISQYDEPLCIGGHLDIQVDGQTRRIGVTRVHLEEDTGKTIHASKTGRIHGAEYALENYNRAGIPLMEIVSEPDLRSPEEARAYVVELRAILLALGICDAKMEEGSLRCDANLSLRRPGASELGTKVEVKNVNSLRSLYRALCYEVERQIAALEAGERLVQETRHFDENTGATVPLRSKEEATDYRYFPEPDLVPLAPSREWVEEIRASLSELPAAARARLRKTYSLPEQDVAVIASSSAGIAFFEELAGGRDAKLAANW